MLADSTAYSLRVAARQAIDDLRARAALARHRDPALDVFLTLVANRLESPLAIAEAETRRADAHAMANAEAAEAARERGA